MYASLVLKYRQAGLSTTSQFGKKKKKNTVCNTICIFNRFYWMYLLNDIWYGQILIRDSFRDELLVGYV